MTPYIKYLNEIFKRYNIYIRGINNIIEKKTEEMINYNFDILIDYKILTNDNPLEIIYNDILLNCNIIIQKMYNNEDLFFSKDKNNNFNIFISNIFIYGIHKNNLSNY